MTMSSQLEAQLPMGFYDRFCNLTDKVVVAIDESPKLLKTGPKSRQRK